MGIQIGILRKIVFYKYSIIQLDNENFSRMLSHQTRKEKLVSSIKYLEFQVQKLINLNCVTKFRYPMLILRQLSSNTIVTRLSGASELQQLPGLRLSSSGSETVSNLDNVDNNVIMREHQKILGLIHDLKFCAAHMRKGLKPSYEL